MAPGEEGAQPLGLAGACGGDAQIGPGEKRRDGDLREERGREVAVERDEAGPGSGGAAEAAVGEGGEDGLARRLEAAGIGNGGDEALGALDGDITVGREVGDAVDEARVETPGGDGGEEVLALGVTADGGEQGRGEACAAQRHGDVESDAAGRAGDAARQVLARGHRGRGAADDVPKDGADAEDIGDGHGIRHGGKGRGGQPRGKRQGCSFFHWWPQMKSLGSRPRWCQGDQGSLVPGMARAGRSGSRSRRVGPVQRILSQRSQINMPPIAAAMTATMIPKACTFSLSGKLPTLIPQRPAISVGGIMTTEKTVRT